MSSNNQVYHGFFFWENKFSRCHCWPYSQAIRIKRICSIDYKLNQQLQNIEQWLVDRGYQRDRIKGEISRVNDIERSLLLMEKEKRVDETVNLTLTFHPALYSVTNIL